MPYEPLLAYPLLLLLTTSFTYGQAVKNSLANDSTFREVLVKTMRYPLAALRGGKVAKAYILFEVDGQGNVADAQVLNQAHVDPSFHEEINRFMSQLPVQAKTYTGRYILPVVFELEGTSQVIKPTEENVSFIESLPKESLLLVWCNTTWKSMSIGHPLLNKRYLLTECF